MDIQVLKSDLSGKASSITLNDAFIAADFNPSLVHQLIVAQQAGARQGSAKQKNRSERSGSTRKPWRQKGTGNARAGMRTSPIWKSGGVTFAARPRDYSQKLNRKMYRAAMACIFSQLQREEALKFVHSIELADHKTKTCLKWLEPFAGERVLVITESFNKNLELGARNLPQASVTLAENINPVDLLYFDTILITEEAAKQLQERFS